MDDPEPQLVDKMSIPRLDQTNNFLFFFLGNAKLFENAMLGSATYQVQVLRMENPSTFIGLFDWSNRLLLRFEKLGMKLFEDLLLCFFLDLCSFVYTSICSANKEAFWSTGS